jgi:heat shock protein HtpX
MVRWTAFFGGFSRDDREDGGGGILGLIVMAILAPIAALIIQMAISRSREYLADSTGALVTRNPLGLASALQKLSVVSERVPLAARPETAHLFITNPLSGQSLLRLFSTHPPLEERIARLRAMAGVR